MNFYETRELLEQSAEPRYRDFNAKIVRTGYPMLGVRVPLLKKIAAKTEGGYLSETPKYYEEVLINGLTLARLSKDAAALSCRLDAFLSLCDNWAVIDTPAAAMKAFKKDRENGFALARRYALDGREFYSRFGAVVCLAHYLDDDYWYRTLELYGEMPQGAYYTDMAVAWGLSVAAVRRFDAAVEAIKGGAFSPFVADKALAKCLDSYRLSPEQKAEVRRVRADIRAAGREAANT